MTGPVIEVADPATGEIVSLTGLPALPGAGPLGLDLPPSLTWEQWSAYGGVLQQAQRSILWLLGDWLRYGERRWPDRYQQAVDATGYAVRTARNAAWVAGSIEPSRRRENAPWWQHAEVAGLGPDAQDELLDWCETDDPRREELRAEIERRGLRQSKAAGPPRDTVDAADGAPEGHRGDLSTDLAAWLTEGRRLAGPVREGVPWRCKVPASLLHDCHDLLRALDAGSPEGAAYLRSLDERGREAA